MINLNRLNKVHITKNVFYLNIINQIREKAISEARNEWLGKKKLADDEAERLLREANQK